MKMSKKDIRRILAEELDLEKLYEPKEDAFGGGENLHLDIDFEKLAGREEDIDGPEVLELTGEARIRQIVKETMLAFAQPEEDPHGKSPHDMNPDEDGVIEPDDLYKHFDIDQDGKVTTQDYKDHIEYHSTHPKMLDPFEKLALKSAPNAMCPTSYEKAAGKLVADPINAHELIRPVMEKTGIGCPASAAKALADVLHVAQGTGVIEHD
tara:strand:- start:1633 stop:2259 length:627 start_codon:yes stop_codon:yes gene_type:complete